MTHRRSSRGFTLVELIVVVLIVGVLAAVGIPQYTRTMETSKADDAASLVKMIGTTNRMYRLDNANYVTGPITSSCNGADCASATGGCKLVACRYLASQAWDQKDYDYWAGDCGSGAGTNATLTVVACVKRKQNASGNYKNWTYRMDPNGVVTESGGAPKAPS